MKKPFFLFILLFIVTSTVLKSQDLIVTLKGDSINCKIQQIMDNRIFFSYLKEGEKLKTMLSMQDITYYETNFYLAQRETVPVHDRYGHSALDFIITGGYGYRTAPVDKDMNQFMQDYIRGIKGGFVIGADIAFYITDEYGGGIKYSSSFNSNRIDNVMVTFQNGSVKNGTVSDDIIITFVGPAFYSRKYTGMNENCFTTSVALGYINYNNNCRVVDPMTITGHTLGFAMDIGYEAQIGNATSLGLKVSYVSGVLSEVTVKDHNGTSTINYGKGNYESLARLDLQATFKIRIF